MKRSVKLLRRLAMLTQLGLSVIAPPLLLIWLAIIAQRRWGVGSWATAAALVAGLISSGCGVYEFYRSVTREKGGDEPPASFDQHL